ncbi:PREDICTED: uncharacterized protein LOC109326140 isoform X1 [Lupinus angustifolius]|uniref:uncharacterized protein LOC109326140 isoform X1 n=1 Tax=Lupinus angustifolius TaxID=3871 RepID=UPI00092E9B16|nr:PREDICTED: uncharacterized protein LOC109326140 isoform X1 [Lupinus angustifolius]
MVSFHEALAESPRAKVQAELEASSKKRKWVEPYAGEFFKNQTNLEERKSRFDIELNLETPYTSDNWRQYLSIKVSGQINMCQDSKRSSTQPLTHHHMSLDLELNLTSESQWKKEVDNSYHMIEKQGSGNSLGSLFELDHDDLIIEPNKHKKDSSNGLVHSLSSPSWFSSSNGDHKEMVATVCMKCHMLIMLCKSSPTCPNCKFMHPPDQNPSNFLKRRSSILY